LANPIIAAANLSRLGREPAYEKGPNTTIAAPASARYRTQWAGRRDRRLPTSI